MRQIHFSAWLLVVLSAILQVIIFPLPGVYVLSWFALTPLIVALLRARPAGELEVAGSVRLRPASPGQGFLLGYLCGILWYAGTCYWIYDTMRQYGGLSAPQAVLALFLFCCYLGLYHGLFGLLFTLLAGSGRDFRRPLVAAPFLWVAVELARTRITGFPWNLLGIAQVDNIALCRIAAWTGVYGISLEIALVNVALAAAFLVPREKRGAMLAAALAAAAVLQAGRLVDAPPAMADRAALLVQQNIPVSADWTPAYYASTLHDLSQLTVNSVTAHPQTKFDLIVWPESPSPFYTNDPQFRATLSDMARVTKAWTVAGSIGTSASQSPQDAPSYQLRRARQPHRRLHRPLRQSSSRSLRRILAVPERVLLRRRTHQRSRRLRPRRIPISTRCRRPAPRRFHLLRIHLSRRGPTVRQPGRATSSSTFPTTDGMATAAPTRST